jgi:hypothetical protein
VHRRGRQGPREDEPQGRPQGKGWRRAARLSQRSITSIRGGPHENAALPASAAGLRARSIPNPTFEANTFLVAPGYISGNAPITGWTGSPATRIGQNPAGISPFYDNGLLPNGNKVAFIQSTGGATSTLSTTITGLTVSTIWLFTNGKF